MACREVSPDKSLLPAGQYSSSTEEILALPARGKWARHLWGSRATGASGEARISDRRYHPVEVYGRGAETERDVAIQPPLESTEGNACSDRQRGWGRAKTGYGGSFRGLFYPLVLVLILTRGPTTILGATQGGFPPALSPPRPPPSGLPDSGFLQVHFIETPEDLVREKNATFTFRVTQEYGQEACPLCNVTCTLDGDRSLGCKNGVQSLQGLEEGTHNFAVIVTLGSLRTIATKTFNVALSVPTATLTYTSVLGESAHSSLVTINFTRPCGGFACNSSTDCGLVVEGVAQVNASTFKAVIPGSLYTVVVDLIGQNGRVDLSIPRRTCYDSFGQGFQATESSRAILRFDQRALASEVGTPIPTRQFAFSNGTFNGWVTNTTDRLYFVVRFNSSLLNSTAEVAASLNVTGGSLMKNGTSARASRRFIFYVKPESVTSAVMVSLRGGTVCNRFGVFNSEVTSPLVFYDGRPFEVILSQNVARQQKEEVVGVMIQFSSPVAAFLPDMLSVEGASLSRLEAASSTLYVADIIIERGQTATISVAKGSTFSLVGTSNAASNTLEIERYAVPTASGALAAVASSGLVASFLASGALSFSMAGLSAADHVPMTPVPGRNLLGLAGHMQIFALSDWLGVPLPITFRETIRSLRWIIPNGNLPWDGSKHAITLPDSYANNMSDASMKAAIYFYGRHLLADYGTTQGRPEGMLGSDSRKFLSSGRQALVGLEKKGGPGFRSGDQLVGDLLGVGKEKSLSSRNWNAQQLKAKEFSLDQEIGQFEKMYNDENDILGQRDFEDETDGEPQTFVSGLRRLLAGKGSHGQKSAEKPGLEGTLEAVEYQTEMETGMVVGMEMEMEHFPKVVHGCVNLSEEHSEAEDLEATSACFERKIYLREAARKKLAETEAPRLSEEGYYDLFVVLPPTNESLMRAVLGKEVTPYAGWHAAGRTLFWMAVVSGVLAVLHGIALLGLTGRHFEEGAEATAHPLNFPRLEIFLLMLAVPGVCHACSVLIEGGTNGGIWVGLLLLVNLPVTLVYGAGGFLLYNVVQRKHVVFKASHRDSEGAPSGLLPGWTSRPLAWIVGQRTDARWHAVDNPEDRKPAFIGRWGVLFENRRGIFEASGSASGDLPVTRVRMVREGNSMRQIEVTEPAQSRALNPRMGTLQSWSVMLEIIYRIAVGVLLGAYGREAEQAWDQVALLLACTIVLFLFLVLTKPYISRGVQLAETLSLLFEIGLFGCALGLLGERDVTSATYSILGTIMLVFFFLTFLVQLFALWHGFYQQVLALAPANEPITFSNGFSSMGRGLLLALPFACWHTRKEEAPSAKVQWRDGLPPSRSRSAKSSKTAGSMEQSVKIDSSGGTPPRHKPARSMKHGSRVGSDRSVEQEEGGVPATAASPAPAPVEQKGNSNSWNSSGRSLGWLSASLGLAGSMASGLFKKDKPTDDEEVSSPLAQNPSGVARTPLVDSPAARSVGGSLLAGLSDTPSPNRTPAGIILGSNDNKALSDEDTQYFETLSLDNSPRIISGEERGAGPKFQTYAQTGAEPAQLELQPVMGRGDHRKSPLGRAPSRSGSGSGSGSAGGTVVGSEKVKGRALEDYLPAGLRKLRDKVAGKASGKFNVDEYLPPGLRAEAAAEGKGGVGSSSSSGSAPTLQKGQSWNGRQAGGKVPVLLRAFSNQPTPPLQNTSDHVMTVPVTPPPAEPFSSKGGAEGRRRGRGKKGGSGKEESVDSPNPLRESTGSTDSNVDSSNHDSIGEDTPISRRGLE